jgi:uncharacterized protein YndB with AHSA1/START domain
MTAQEAKSITVSALVNAKAERVWELWTSPEHITKWNCASPDWHSPRAAHDLTVGGQFNFRMEAKDGSMGFDFEGTYDVVTPNQYLEYTMTDGRKVKISFEESDGKTFISETFEAESTNSLEMQQDGWQSILDNFKSYTENNK